MQVSVSNVYCFQRFTAEKYLDDEDDYKRRTLGQKTRFGISSSVSCPFSIASVFLVCVYGSGVNDDENDILCCYCCAALLFSLVNLKLTKRMNVLERIACTMQNNRVTWHTRDREQVGATTELQNDMRRVFPYSFRLHQEQGFLRRE